MQWHRGPGWQETGEMILQGKTVVGRVYFGSLVGEPQRMAWIGERDGQAKMFRYQVQAKTWVAQPAGA